MMLVNWELPIKTISEANTVEHWSKKNARHKKQKAQIVWKWIEEKPKITLPCTVRLTRLAPRKLDEDNNIIAFKWIKDALAARIILGKEEKKGSIGRSDGDARIRWIYDQERAAKPGFYGVRIQIYCDRCDSQSWPTVRLTQCRDEITHCDEQIDLSELYPLSPLD